MVLINIQSIVHVPSFQSTSPGWSLSFSVLLIFVPAKTNCFHFSDLLGIFYHYTSTHCLLFLRDNWVENIQFMSSLFNCKDWFWIQTFAWKNQVPPPLTVLWDFFFFLRNLGQENPRDFCDSLTSDQNKSRITWNVQNK